MKRKFFLLFLEVFIFLAVYFAGLYLMVSMRIMEKLLSPSYQGGIWAIVLACGFLLMRMILILVVPGWILARVFCIASESFGKSRENPSESTIK